ncbi:HAMP domain-containing histidine kinase [Clostridium estertheticum]|uniref:HAMP domain-containing sensor histidine kinase n=1 Tax=Clostridium estertheticum TaxID=238834 RepID=UPI0013E95979|nr:HAMP domain-containing sensor histidine kinase [Clostridium estertheticum]MBZ9689869.1 HAMP domain-containing histidine kinase [Clostridium estertheticum]
MKINLITSKIGTNLLLSILVSLILSMLVSVLFNLTCLAAIMPSPSDFFLALGAFILSFLLIINTKVKYIKYIAERVKKISNDDLGTTIEIRGKDELAELSEIINSMSKELKCRRELEKEIEAAKNELITNISHDLRTPLTSIVGYVDLLRKKEYKNEEQLCEYIDTIYHKSQHLQMLIDELFEYTKLTTPGIKINYSNVNLSGLLEQMIGEYVPIFIKEDLLIRSDIPQDIYINVDIEKIVRVFDNILINAKKYSSKPSDIHVNLCYKNNKVIVSISNKTDQIQVENLDLIFEKFYRVDTSRKGEDGSGLGLAIAKRIVELHQGKIWAEYKDHIITFNIELYIQE